MIPMETINREYIVEYIRGLYRQCDPFLLSLERYAEENHIPILEPETAKLLECMLAVHKPKRILELGTAIGYSALCMANASDARITTIEINAETAKLAEKNIHEYGKSDRIEVLVGDGVERITGLKGSYDFVLIDAAKGHYKEYFDACLPLLEDGALVFSDNVLFKGTIAKPSLAVRRKRTIVHRMRDYLDYITTLEGVCTSVIPLGDGVALSVIGSKEQNGRGIERIREENSED